MVKLVLGAKGKGKTKFLLENANSEALKADGLVIYLDKNSKHIFELNRNIRLINIKEYPVQDLDSLIGFICGLISGNNDIESIYFDSFLVLANLEGQNPSDAINKLIILSERLKVNFIVSISVDEHEIDDNLKDYIELSL